MGIGETNPAPGLVVRFQGALHRRRRLRRLQLDLGPPLMVTVSLPSHLRPNLPIFKLVACRAVRLAAAKVLGVESVFGGRDAFRWVGDRPREVGGRDCIGRLERDAEHPQVLKISKSYPQTPGMELTRHRGYPYNWCAPRTNITRGITLRALSRGIRLGFDLHTDIRHLAP